MRTKRGGETMKVISPIGRSDKNNASANYGGIEPKGGCICYQSDTNADAKGLNIFCIGCRSNCFPDWHPNYNPDNAAANQALAESKTML